MVRAKSAGEKPLAYCAVNSSGYETYRVFAATPARAKDLLIKEVRKYFRRNNMSFYRDDAETFREESYVYPVWNEHLIVDDDTTDEPPKRRKGFAKGGVA